MSDEKKPKKPEQPKQLKDDRVRVCGKWREKGYKASKEEEAEYKRQQEIVNAGNERIDKINKGTAKK